MVKGEYGMTDEKIKVRSLTDEEVIEILTEPDLLMEKEIKERESLDLIDTGATCVSCGSTIVETLHAEFNSTGPMFFGRGSKKQYY